MPSSACLAMNDDKIPAGKYSVSTSNRNFEGRQGPGARTLLALSLIHIFPISSPGDFNSVIEISKAVTWPTICALTRAVEKDIDVDVYKRQGLDTLVVHTVNDEYSLFAIYCKRPSESVKYSTWGVRRQR